MPDVTTKDIREQFQRILGRDPRESEIAEFIKFTNTGAAETRLGAEDVGRIIEGLPEARMGQLTRYGGEYGKQLAQGDTDLLSRAQTQLTGDFARQGRQTTSSAYVSAYANAARDLALNRQNKLAEFYGQGYSDIFGGQGRQAEQTRGIGLGNFQQSAEYGRQKEMATIQKEQYNSFLNQKRRLDLPWQYANLALGGIKAGASAYGASQGTPSFGG